MPSGWMLLCEACLQPFWSPRPATLCPVCAAGDPDRIAPVIDRVFDELERNAQVRREFEENWLWMEHEAAQYSYDDYQEPPYVGNIAAPPASDEPEFDDARVTWKELEF